MAHLDKSSPRRRQTADDIRELRGLEAVRLHPGMYVGFSPREAIYDMTYIALDTPIEEAMAGHSDQIDLVIHQDTSITVSDDGRGIPVDIQPALNISILEIILTKVTIGSFGYHFTYSVCGGIHGIGLKAVNALSERMIVEVRRDGFLWRQSFARGVRTSDLEHIRPLTAAESTGTSITFRPDIEMFHEIPDESVFKYDTLRDRCRQLAYILHGVTIHLTDQRVQPLPREATFHFEGGLETFVHDLNEGRAPLHSIVSGSKTIRFDRDEQTHYIIEVEFAFQYTEYSHNTELGFVNTLEILNGGTYEKGLWTALAQTLNEWARKTGFVLEQELTERGARVGLTAIVALKHPYPHFETMTNVKLLNPEVSGIVASVVSEFFTEHLESDPNIARRILDNFRRQKENG